MLKVKLMWREGQEARSLDTLLITVPRAGDIVTHEVEGGTLYLEAKSASFSTSTGGVMVFCVRTGKGVEQIYDSGTLNNRTRST